MSAGEIALLVIVVSGFGWMIKFLYNHVNEIRDDVRKIKKFLFKQFGYNDEEPD